MTTAPIQQQTQAKRRLTIWAAVGITAILTAAAIIIYRQVPGNYAPLTSSVGLLGFASTLIAFLALSEGIAAYKKLLQAQDLINIERVDTELVHLEAELATSA